MKVKLKFDMDKVKEFGKEHGEKFLLAGAVLIMGMFIVNAFSRETLPDKLQASQIETKSRQADEKIKSLPAPPKTQDVTNVDFVSLVKKETGVPKVLSDILPIIKEPFPDLVKRVDPTLFAIEEIRATPFRGGIVTLPREGGRVDPTAGPPPGLVPGRVPAARPAAARPGATPRPATGGLVPTPAVGAAQGEMPFPADFHPPGPASTGYAEGHYGIVVTGLIPAQAQREEYERRFKNARRGVTAEGPSNAPRVHGTVDGDSPQYVWCYLERTDVTAGKTIVLDFGNTEEIKRAWQTSPEAKAQVTKLAITAKVRNRLEAAQRDWGAQPTEVVDREFLSDKWFSWALPPVLLRVWGAEAAHPPKIPLALPVAHAASPDGAPAAAPQSNTFDDTTTTGPSRRHEPAGAGPRTEAVEVPYKLFRFVDLEVEPGHAYQYRVRMLLQNPNFGLEAQVLLKPETASVAYNPTPWSAMSPSVLIPQNTRLLGGSIDRPLHKEPKAKVSVFTFDKAQAIELIKEFDTEMGALIGTTVPDQIAKNVADPVKKQVRDITGEFRTGSVLLDFRGDDEKLPGAPGLTDPAEMLLLDDIDHPENPRLIVVNEAKDKPIIELWTKTHVPDAAAAANGAPEPAKAPAGPAKAGGLIPGGGLLPGTPKTGTPRRPTGRPN